MKLSIPIFTFLMIVIFISSCNSESDTDKNKLVNRKKTIAISSNVLIGKWQSFLSDGSYEFDKEFVFKEDNTGIYLDSHSYNSGTRYTTSAVFEIEWELDTINFETLSITFKKGKMGGSDFMDDEVKQVINEFSFTTYSDDIDFENENAFRYEIGSRNHRFIKSN